MVAFVWSAWLKDSTFFFLIHCSCTSSDPLNSSTKSTNKSLDFLIAQTIFSKSLINDLKIFSTTQQVDSVSPFLSSCFTMVSTRKTYSATPSFILMFSSSPFRVWSLTCFTQLSPLYSFSRIFHASFEDLSFFYLLKLGLINNLIQHVQSRFVLYPHYSQRSRRAIVYSLISYGS